MIARNRGEAATTVREVTAVVLRTEITPPWRTAAVTMTEMFVTAVRVRLADGTEGWGECCVRAAPNATKVIVDELLGPQIVGSDATEVEGLWQRMFESQRSRGHTRGFLMEAISGVDIALWDALGRSLRQPIHRLLHGISRRTLECYASSIFLGDPDAMIDEAVRLVNAGYSALKVKIGRDIHHDVRVIHGMRDVLGDAVEIMVDANGALHAHQALAVMDRLSDCRLAFFEEPIPMDDLTGYRKLAAAGFAIPIAAGEAEGAPGAFAPYVAERLIDIVQPDVGRTGGITASRKVANLADAFHVEWAPHTGASSGICIAASLQLAAAVPNLRIWEDMYTQQPLQELFVEQLPRQQEGMVSIPQAPGLGLGIDAEKISFFAVTPI
ncbi:MAG TPA: mandelate racemase/muconate lactonizing enzyme family protein [Solirubrobacteraceae bacterium]|jgi:L-alanine-DL-glutamate epimerase-like enolase superfamily enzyme